MNLYKVKLSLVDETDLDLYTDYLISSFSQTSSTGLSNLLNKAISHDDVTRFLNKTDHSSKALWKIAKPLIRQIESGDGLLILDDSISEKPYTDSNGLICPHFDHCTGKFVNRINFVSLLYRNKSVQLPIGFELVIKTLQSIIKIQKECWRSTRTKNEMFRDLIRCADQNTVKFTFILCDSCWAARAVC